MRKTVDRKFGGIGKRIAVVAALATAITAIQVGSPGVWNWVSSWLPTDVKGLTELTILGFVLLWWWQFQAARAMHRLLTG